MNKTGRELQAPQFHSDMEFGADRMHDKPPTPPPATGIRYSEGKLRGDLVPMEWELELARIMTAGASKYAENNWTLGMPWKLMFGAARRHLWKFMSGESYDQETGCHHLAMVAWNMLALMYYDMHRLGTDTRLPARPINDKLEWKEPA